MAGQYNYNGRQIELFHMKWFVDRLTGPRLMSLQNEVGASVKTFLQVQ